jgi:hypothetical protein
MSRADFGRRIIQIVELDLDRCANTYGVAPCTAAAGAGNECYNTYRSCQDIPNYVKGTYTYRFAARGTPMPIDTAYLRPYITRLDTAPTQIDPKDGLGLRAKATVAMEDEPDSDVEQDPYIATRASAAGSTFWRRLLARNHNYAGRFARVRRALLTPGPYAEYGYAETQDDYVAPGPAIYYGLTNSTAFTDELYIIEAIKGPSATGEIQVVLKDPIKLTDRVKVPIPTDGKLTGAITSAATTIPLTTGKGAQYDKYGYPCFVLIGKEIISIGSRSGDTLNVSAHAQFNTVAAAHQANDVVQLCRSWSGARITQVMQDLITESGLASSYIDTAQMLSEDDQWLAAKYYITACLIKPEDASKLLQELVLLANGLLWWDVESWKVKFKVHMPAAATETVPELNDASHFVEDSMAVEQLDDQRLTAAAIFYGLNSPIDNESESVNYALGAVHIDTDAESANEYDDVRAETLYAKWFGAANSLAAQALVSRMVSYRRNVQRRIKFSLDPKDKTFKVGALIDINTAAIVGLAGANNVTRTRVTKLIDKGDEIQVEALTNNFRNRYAYIGPAGMPSYASATEAQRSYAFICNASGLMSNGDTAYLII